MTQSELFCYKPKYLAEVTYLAVLCSCPSGDRAGCIRARNADSGNQQLLLSVTESTQTLCLPMGSIVLPWVHKAI